MLTVIETLAKGPLIEEFTNTHTESVCLKSSYIDKFIFI